MSIKIDCTKCNGCGFAKESLCMKVCPGDLLRKNNNNKAEIIDKSECWDCAACVKECPKSAISMYLQPEIGGRGTELTAKKTKESIVWTVKKIDGTEETIECRNSSVI